MHWYPYTTIMFDCAVRVQYVLYIPLQCYTIIIDYCRNVRYNLMIVKLIEIQLTIVDKCVIF